MARITGEICHSRISVSRTPTSLSPSSSPNGQNSHLIAVTLIKTRLLVDLQGLVRAKQEVGPHLPQEILDSILKEAANTSIVKKNHEILERDDHGPSIEEMKKQVRQLYNTVDEANKHFWPAVVRPTMDNMTAMPIYTSRGNRQEMQLQLRYWYNAWAETPGAIGVIEELVDSSWVDTFSCNLVLLLTLW